MEVDKKSYFSHKELLLPGQMVSRSANLNYSFHAIFLFRLLTHRLVIFFCNAEKLKREYVHTCRYY
jgi:hypothetical protein